MASSASLTKHVVLTGDPGVGKTTLVCKIFELLKAKGVKSYGFYTKERRVNGEREGFDVITLDGSTAPLASVGNRSDPQVKGKKWVGRYTVNLEEFERLALPALQLCKDHGDSTKVLLLIDEIGKMELFSRRFELLVEELFEKSGNFSIIATIPSARSRPIELVEKVRKMSTVKVFEVTKANRNSILKEVIESIESCLGVP